MIISIAGDFSPRERVSVLFQKENYAFVLADVKEKLALSDYSIVNLECPVVIGDEKPIVKVGPNLWCSEKGVNAIKWTGFDCVTLANNHIYDYGDKGVHNTIEWCRSHHIDTVGAGFNLKDASRVLYKSIGNKTLSIVNCCEHEFSIATDRSSGAHQHLLLQPDHRVHPP